MKFFQAVAMIASFYAFRPTAAEGEDLECTHGKLYLVDNTTANLHVLDISSGHLEDLSVDQDILSLPSSGAGQLILQSSGSGEEVVVMYRGEKEQGYMDGYVRVVNSGLDVHDHDGHQHVEYEPPSLIENAGFSCARAIHYVRHDDKIAFFCDGSYEHDPQVNSTVWVLDETKFGSPTENALVYSETLQGSHHGVAIPVDDNHVLYSLAHENRTNREPSGTDYALPETFQVVDYQGNILHEITDTSSKDTSCQGFHGSTAMDNTFALACDASHGGVVIVEYDAQASTYTSRALSYPDGAAFDDLRVGSFAEHALSDHFVGSFAVSGGTTFHLLAMTATDTQVTSDNVLTLPDRQCGYYFELGKGQVVLALMPNGFLHAFSFENGSWSEVAKQEVVPGMLACSEAIFVPGVAQAFVATPDTKKLYAVDLAHVTEGKMVVHTSNLPFTPAGMIVAGFTEAALCDGHESHEHGDEHGDSSARAASLISVALVIIAGIFM